MMTDPIADFLTRIRNAAMVRKEEILAPSSKIKVEIAKILVDEGYLAGYSVYQDGVQSMIRVNMKYAGKSDVVIHEIKRVSSPGRRMYVGSTDIKDVCGGLGINILSTSKGLMTGKNAKQLNIGGELICEIW